jgi:hypothetical protein
MAHFAQLENNVVIQVIVVSNQDTADEHGVEKEDIGIDFCKLIFGQDTVWVQTSYNKNFRKNYAGIGDTYDEGRDAFIAPKPFASWVLDETTCRWKAPVEKPVDDKKYTWDEATTSWVEAPVGE